MSNESYSGFVVVLKDDINEEDTKKIIDGISMIRGVIDIQPIEKEKIDQRVMKSRTKSELMKIIEDAVKDF